MIGFDGTVIGVEWDPAACATRAAAGHLAVRASVATLPRERMIGRVTGAIFSPPCPTFSAAGARLGRRLEAELQQAVRDALNGQRNLATHRRTMAHKLRSHFLSEGKMRRTAASTLAWDTAREASLSVEPARWIADLKPRWVAMEQVPGVLPLWRVYADELRSLGYSVWCGELNAADFGVPQTRKRAFLIASLDRVATPPDPTHCRGGASGLFGELAPWVSMAQALGWGMTARPSTTLVTGAGQGHTGGADPLDGGSGSRATIRREIEAGRFVGFPRKDDRGDSPDGYRERDWRPDDEPSFTVTDKARSWVSVRRGPRPGDEIGANLEEGFDPDTEPSQTVTSKVNRWHVDHPDAAGETESETGPDPATAVVRTGTNSSKHSRRPEDLEPYERSVNEPSPVITHQSAAWKVGESDAIPQPPMRWKEGGVNTGRDWKKGGSRQDAQTIPFDEPAPTVTTESGAQWQLMPGLSPSQPNRRPYDLDEPAPTVAFGHDTNGWYFDRPATTIQGDARVFHPGGHIANDGRDNSKMKGRSEDAIRLEVADALVLQSFRPDYPVQGNRTQQFTQVGNAVPPLLAAHVLASLLGLASPHG